MRATSLLMPRRILAGSAPSLVLATLYWTLRFVFDAGSFLKLCVWLGSGLLVLALAGWWMGRELALPRRVLLCGAIVLGTISAAWAWQRLAYVILIPEPALTYGYFLTASGKTARLLLLQVPFGLGTIILMTSLLLALVWGWRGGVRWMLASLTIWWITAFTLFALPSFFLWGQGDAAIFI